MDSRTRRGALLTLHDLIEMLAKDHTRHAVGLRRDLGLRWWSSRRLYTEVWRVAAFLKNRGIGPGDKVMIRAGNSPEWVACFFGIAWRGAVAVLLDERHPQSAAMASTMGVRLVFHDGEAPGGDGLDWIPVTDIDTDDHSLKEKPGVPVTPDDPAAILFTAGTTALPKATVLNHDHILSQVRIFMRFRALARIFRPRMLVVPPLCHIFGLIVGLALPLSLGIGVIYTHSHGPVHLLRTILDNRVNILTTVPRTLQTLANALVRLPPGRPDRPVTGLLRLLNHKRKYTGLRFRLIFVGGARLPLATERFWRRLNLMIVQGYGLTETTAMVSITNPFSSTPGTIGRPVGQQDVRLTADGEIMVKGPNITAGHLVSRPEARTANTEGYFKTGDIARYDNAKRLIFLGRKEDMIITGEGYAVYPDDIEDVLNQLTGVCDSAVIPHPGQPLEEVHAVLVPAPGADPADIVRRANASLQPHQLIKSWSPWPEPELPRNNMQKLLRSRIAARIGDPRANGSGPDDPRRRFPNRVHPARSAPLTLEMVRGEPERPRRIRLLAEYLLRATPERASDEDPGLMRDLGFSSLDIVELLFLLEADQPHVSPAVDENITVKGLRRQLGASTAPGETGGTRRGIHAPVDTLPVLQPRWSLGIAARIMRPVCRRLVTALWTLLEVTISTRRKEDPASVTGPFILCATPHRHWLDTLAICHALPEAHRRRILAVTNDRFQEYFAPDASVPPYRSALIAGLYYIGVPLLFCFTILPPFGRTRDGLLETGRLLDHNYSAITYPKGFAFWGDPHPRRHDAGAALLSIETGLPILPVFLHGNGDIAWRLRRPRKQITVHFGRLIKPRPGDHPGEIIRRVEAAFDEMRNANPERIPPGPRHVF